MGGGCRGREQGGIGETLTPSIALKALILFPTQFDDLISCYGKPVEWPNEIAYEIQECAISLVRFTGFPKQLIGS